MIPFRKRVQLLISVVSTLVMLIAVVTAAVVGKTVQIVHSRGWVSTSWSNWLVVHWTLVLWRASIVGSCAQDIDHYPRNSNIEDFISVAKEHAAVEFCLLL